MDKRPSVLAHLSALSVLRNLQILQTSEKFPTREQPKLSDCRNLLSQLVHPYNRAGSYVTNNVAAGPTDLEIALQIVGESSKMLDGVCYHCAAVLRFCREGGRRKVQSDLDIFICVKTGWKVG